MNTPEEKYNAFCKTATDFLQEKKLADAFEAAKNAFDVALYMAQFAPVEARPKWLFRAEKTLTVARGIDEAIRDEKIQPASAKQDVETEHSGVASSERPKERLSDVSGMQTAKDEVRMSVIEPIRKPEKAKKYGLRMGGGLLLYGLPGTGKTFFAKAVAGELGLPFYVIKTDDILCKYLGESEKIVKKIFDTARSNPMSVIYIDETNGILPSRSDENVHEVSKRIAEIILQETDGIDSKEKNPFLLIGSTNYPDKIDDAALSRFSACIEVALPNAETRQFILKKELGAMEINIANAAIDFLVKKTDGFSCRDLVNLAGFYRKMAAKDEIQEFTAEFAEQNFQDSHVASSSIAQGIELFKKRMGQNPGNEKKKLTNEESDAAVVPVNADTTAVNPEQTAEAASATASAVSPTEMPEKPEHAPVTFADVKGLEEAKAVVMRALINPLRYPEIYKTMGLIPGNGLLLYGPPGTGKTMFARAIANELNCEFYTVTLEDVRGKTPLETSAKIKSLFAEARKNVNGSVLFLDDCEEILSRPGNAKAYGVSQFLTELDGLKDDSVGNRIFLLIATNRPWMIDGALLRSGRISASAYIALPDFEVRREMIAAALKGIQLAEDVNLDELARLTDGYSGAEIFHARNGGGICNLARDYAADRWVKRIAQNPEEKDVVESVTMADFQRAIAAIVPCAIKDAERIARNQEFADMFSHNTPAPASDFACRTRSGNIFAFSLPDVLQIKTLVFNSQTILNVPDYKHFADTVYFYFNESNVGSTTFNAFASDVYFVQMKFNLDIPDAATNPNRPAIVVFDGLNMGYTVVAAAYLKYSDNMLLTRPEKLREVLREMNWQLHAQRGTFGKPQLQQIVDKFELFPDNRQALERIKTLASTMLAFVIAHELGHVVRGDNFKKPSESVYTRNMERAADQFAAEIFSGIESPLIRDYMFLGAALGFITNTACGNADVVIDVEDNRTHPATLERFNNLLKLAPPTLKRFNLTEDIFRACMP